MSAHHDAAAPYGELRLGDSGEWVTYAQALLATHGLGPDEVDGRYTATTEALVRRFQAGAGLPADGVIGAATWDALQSMSSSVQVVFDARPSLTGTTLEWSVTNAGPSTVAAFTVIGDYEIRYRIDGSDGSDASDGSDFVWATQTFSNINDLKPGAAEAFFVDLENVGLGGLGDGAYTAVVRLGTQIDQLDFDVAGARLTSL
jgi:peptidoglycan hydrolase-like protein with peptidoglycan-binding domain